MKKLQNTSLIRAEKTLIIACHKYYPGNVGEWKENVFLMESSVSVLQRYNVRQQEHLRYYVEEKGCRQILVVGHHHTYAVRRISDDHSPHSPLSALTFNLKLFLGTPDKDAIPQPFREQLLVEMNTLQQCQWLMENDFIQERVNHSALRVIGIVAGTPDRNAKQLFYNGISYNNLVSLN
jgi:carbonic anhydrase